MHLESYSPCVQYFLKISIISSSPNYHALHTIIHLRHIFLLSYRFVNTLQVSHISWCTWWCQTEGAWKRKNNRSNRGNSNKSSSPPSVFPKNSDLSIILSKKISPKRVKIYSTFFISFSFHDLHPLAQLN